MKFNKQVYEVSAHTYVNHARAKGIHAVCVCVCVCVGSTAVKVLILVIGVIICEPHWYGR